VNLLRRPQLTLEFANLTDLMPLRHFILRPTEPDDSRCTYPGDTDERALHLLASIKGSAVGMVSVLPQPRRFARFGLASSRMRAFGILPKYQRTGLGTELLIEAFDHIADGGHLPLWGSGRSHLSRFYKAMGAEIASPTYDIPGTGDHIDFYFGA
jgi:GNAT superfamily N-acetyltransferase